MASQKGHLEAVELLLARGADVDIQEAADETALHVAAYYGQLGVVVALLKHGADRRILNKEGKTPLDLASKEGHQKIAQALRQAVEKHVGVESKTDGQPLSRSSSHDPSFPVPLRPERHPHNDSSGSPSPMMQRLMTIPIPINQTSPYSRSTKAQRDGSSEYIASASAIPHSDVGRAATRRRPKPEISCVY